VKPLLAFDIETKGFSDEILGFSFCNDSIQGSYPFSPKLVNSLLSEYRFVFHNAKYDVSILRRNGIDIPRCKPGLNAYLDTMVMCWVINPTEYRYGLDVCCQQYEVSGKSGKPETFEVWDEVMAEYALADAIATWELFKVVSAKLKEDKIAAQMFKNIEMPYVEAVITMESWGMHIDSPLLDQTIQQFDSEIQQKLIDLKLRVGLVPELTQVSGVVQPRVKTFKKPYKRNGILYGDRCELEEFNPSSSLDVFWVLTTQEGWEPQEFTPTGLPCVKGDVLPDTPIANLIRELLDLQKIRNTFLLGIKNNLRGVRVFGSFNQLGTKTGRLSSSEPNLQNIPSSKHGDIVRSIFIPPPGYAQIGADLSNIEGRVLAHLLEVELGDSTLSNLFREGIDFHAANAKSWGLDQLYPDPKQARSAAKCLFPLIYGGGAATIGSFVGAPKHKQLEIGKRIIEMIDQNFPSLSRLRELLVQRCRDQGGLIHTWFGRRLLYPYVLPSNAKQKAIEKLKKEGKGDLKEMTDNLLKQSERQIFNAVIQGTAADVLKILTGGVLDIVEKYNSQFVVSVHDEVQLYSPMEFADVVCEELDQLFRSPLLEGCPIMGEVKKGFSWYECH
jgi:DNA polymerase-1